jgi:diphthamide synthase (EF-2-diphthine--ammonia ligase)
VATGAILSNYQRTRVEAVCMRLGLVSLAFLWQSDQAELLDEMIHAGARARAPDVSAAQPTPRSLPTLHAHALGVLLFASSAANTSSLCHQGAWSPVAVYLDRIVARARAQDA